MMEKKNGLMKKSALLFALMLAFVFAFAGCNKGGTATQETTAGTVAPNAQTVTLKITCAKLVEQPDVVPANKKDLVPADGNILVKENVEITEGETVFNLLERLCKENNVQMDYDTSMGVYVTSIGNIAQKDCGNESGWTYKVNGEIAQVGAGDYKLKSGDVVEFIYVLSYADMM